jgi:integrase
MASIGRDKNGFKRILFTAPDRKRKTVRLGKCSLRVAESVKTKVESLVSSQLSGQSLDDETARWVAGLDTTMSDKLAAVGLIQKQRRATLRAFVDEYTKSRTDVKPRTQSVYQQTRRCLLGFFGTDRSLQSISSDDAAKWRTWLATDQKLSDNTTRRRVGIARQFFSSAVRQKLITENPFAGIAATVRGNPQRAYFISREHAQRVLDACPNNEWRLNFALARFGALRIPSELLALTWDDIDWDRGRIRVTCVKTAHTGKTHRTIPMAEIRAYLDQARFTAKPGEKWVITKCRNSSVNLRTQFERIILRAGLEPWPKLFQNLRATKETEWARDCGPDLACRWAGNSIRVASEHYFQMRDEDFDRANSAARIPAQYPSTMEPYGHVQASGASEEPNTNDIDNSLLRKGLPIYTVTYAKPLPCKDLRSVRPAGLEPATSGLEIRCSIH